jgi:phytoene desaturase
MSGRKRVIVAGAGIGGLSAAIRLAARGYRVTVVEKLDRPGGKMGELRAGGFRWDTGPSVITMRHVYERLFAEAGRDLRDYLDLVQLDPVTRYFWRDGATLDAVANEDAMCENIRRAFGQRDVDGYRKFMRYARRLHDVVTEPFLYRQKPAARDLLRLPLADVFKIDALRTMHQANRSFFKDPHLIQLFDRFATYNGSSPYQAPATLNVIAHVEMAQGAWYSRGGIYQFALAWERLAKKLGVEMRYECGVQEICVEGGKATGVRLESGEILHADAVVCNVDYTWAMQNLIRVSPLMAHSGHKPHTLSPLESGGRPEPSSSGFVLMLGVRGQFDALAHHNIFFNADYPREFDDIFKRKIAPHDPAIYLCITSKTDPDHAPTGCENWFALVNAPYLSDAFDWAEQAGRYATHIRGLLVSRVGQINPISNPPHRGVPQSLISAECTLTPLDLQNRYGGNRGAIYGFSSNTRAAAFMRPGNRANDVGGLYFASGSAHPGGGVPLVTLSGMAAAECVDEDLH